MAPMETQEVMEGVFAVLDQNVNLFLLGSQNGFIAVDAGNTRQSVQQELQKLNIDPQNVIAVFLTHTDSDHVGALDIFTNATVYLSSAEEQMIDGRTARFLVFKNKLNLPHKLLEDNQSVSLPGFTIRGILTPGHTPGAMCYVVNDTILFVGDSMRFQKGKATLFIPWINMDSGIQRESLKKLMGLHDVKHVFTAHYGFSDQYQKIW
jgi:glyoxylase-like metal-dependent hydrolase (beta-lactamase superfamily II)